MRANVVLLAALVGCDNKLAFRKPDPSLNRMLEQPRVDAYDPSGVFADGKAMREPPRGTIPHDVAPESPPPVTRALLEAGRARFDVFCAPCHGIRGDGVSVVATKMEFRKPPSFLEGRYATLDARAVATTIAQGFGLMPSYADALSEHDRWAVAEYVQALRFARTAKIEALPPALRAELEKEAP